MVGSSFFPNHGLRKRKKRCDWSSGKEISNRPLFVVGVSATEGQLVRLRFVVDSRANPVDESGQKILAVSFLRTTERWAPEESLELNNTERSPEAVLTKRSGRASASKSATVTETAPETP